jgi:hypothetical protein
MSGSSHTEYNRTTLSKSTIWRGHINTFAATQSDSTVIILPNKHHRLDYYNNQYDKAHNQQLYDNILTQLPIDEINKKLKEGWNYTGGFSIDVPRWILREFFSLWIEDCLSNSYSTELYNVSSTFTIDAQDIFLNFNKVLQTIIDALELTINIDQVSIDQNHKTFLSLQRYHNSQLNCEQWVHAVLTKENMPTPCQTIYDESYIQHYLRILGYEIQCNGLIEFPKDSIEMNTLIYKNT